MAIIHICLILIGLSIALAYGSVEISPDIEEIQLNENDTLIINCTGSNPVFIYPANSTDIPTSAKSFSRHNFGDVENLILFKNKTVFGDSGWYGCVDADSSKNLPNLDDVLLTPYNYNNSEVKWIYVYVKSNTNHIVGSPETFNTIDIIVGDDILIPCRPSSPQYNIQLLKDVMKVIKSDERVTFDPRRGFMIKYAKVMDTGYYQCISEGTDQELVYWVRVSRKLSYFAQPIVRYSVEDLIVKGELRMNCSVEIDNDIQHRLSMEVPNESSKVSKTFYRHKYGNLMSRVVLELVIKNFTQNEEGLYNCTISTYNHNSTSSKYITLNDGLMQFRKLKEIEMKKNNFNTDGMVSPQQISDCNNKTELSSTMVQSLSNSISEKLMPDFKQVIFNATAEILKSINARLESLELEINKIKNVLPVIN